MTLARDKTDRRVVSGLALLFAFACTSCGKEETQGVSVHPVSGQVFYLGKPITGASVMFHPTSDPNSQSPRPHGQVDREGAFTLTTYRSGDGAPIGDYVVTIELRKTTPGRAGGGESLIPPKYGNPKESPLRATVTAGKNEIESFRIN